MTREGWGVGKIALVLYPFGWGAVAVNLFFFNLIVSWVGVPVLPLHWALWGGAVLGVPVTYVFARHIRLLMDRADS
ncbi:NnrT protein [Marivita sp. GX14005]|uniref:NnrT protein n=1 Tax=Marivita sp. GX14005 TaxID=2942276 RepID=UPI002019539E|nr:NnrT protein [Marivita sp. GX14005]MCL3882721.1 NnrT protein [Marivita sp. GX14005]